MNVIVVPDGAMIVVPLIEKNGHNYLSPTNFSKDDNTDICDGNLKIGRFISRYSNPELPSGVKSRLLLFDKVVNDADAAIVIERPSKTRVRLYSTLNELILFGSNSCNNAHILMLKMIKDSNIPTLYLKYPNTQNQLIQLIEKTNHFLKTIYTSTS